MTVIDNQVYVQVIDRVMYQVGNQVWYITIVTGKQIGRAHV